MRINYYDSYFVVYTTSSEKVLTASIRISLRSESRCIQYEDVVLIVDATAGFVIGCGWKLLAGSTQMDLAP